MHTMNRAEFESVNEFCGTYSDTPMPEVSEDFLLILSAPADTDEGPGLLLEVRRDDQGDMVRQETFATWEEGKARLAALECLPPALR